MSPALVPDGLEPLGVWDAGSEEWARGPYAERAEWVRKHIGNPNFIYRVEFYVQDMAFAVMHAFARDSSGFKRAINGEALTDPPAVVLLAELPPVHLLKAAA